MGSLGKLSLAHLIDMIDFRQSFCLKGLNFQRNDDFLSVFYKMETCFVLTLLRMAGCQYKRFRRHFTPEAVVFILAKDKNCTVSITGNV